MTPGFRFGDKLSPDSNGIPGAWFTGRKTDTGWRQRVSETTGKRAA